MSIYEVTIARTEGITFRLEAASPEDAEERYLLDGDETGSKTLDTVVESVELAELPMMNSVHSPDQGWHLEPAGEPGRGEWVTVTWPGGGQVRVRPGSMAYAIATGFRPEPVDS